MKRIKIAELKDHLSEHLRAVERGAVVEVTDRSRPIARIIPIREPRRRVAVVPAVRSFAELKRKRYPAANWPVDVVELLLEERGKR
jgi:prevent-host-death family protein